MDGWGHHDNTKWIALAFYLAMIAGGGWCAWQWLAHGGKGIIFMAGAFPALFGGYLLWADFISPSREPM